MNFKIPFLAGSRHFKSLEKQWNVWAQEVWETGQFLNGPQVDSFEKKMANYCGRTYGVALGSCSDALTVSMKYLGFKKSNKVLVSNLSFLSSASSILRAGAQPKFVDVNNQFYCPSLSDYRLEMDQDVKAVVAVNLYGTMLEMESLEQYCKENNLVLIEDGAQSLGSCERERKAGSFGFASCVSFDPTKVLSGSTTGGMILTDSVELRDFARQFRSHGRDDHGEFSLLGIKSLLSSTEAHLLYHKMDRLDGWIKDRNHFANLYMDGLSGLKEVALPKSPKGASHSYHKFVISVDNRDELLFCLQARGIDARVHYEKLISEYRIMAPFKAVTPKSKALTDRLLSLPIYPELLDEEVRAITQIIKEFHKKRR